MSPAPDGPPDPEAPGPSAPGPAADGAAAPPAGRGRGGTVFWRVAGVLVGAQVATALLAVALGAVFARDRSQELLAGTLRLRLDAVAEEVEARAEVGPFGGVALGPRLRADLATRFPDPLALLDERGAVRETFGGAPADVPAGAVRALEAGRVAVALDAPGGGWGWPRSWPRTGSRPAGSWSGRWRGPWTRSGRGRAGRSGRRRP